MSQCAEGNSELVGTTFFCQRGGGHSGKHEYIGGYDVAQRAAVMLVKAERERDEAQEQVVCMWEHLIGAEPDHAQTGCYDCDSAFREAGLEPDSPRDALKEVKG